MKAAYNIIGHIRTFFFIVLMASYTYIGHAEWQTISPGVSFQDLGGSISKLWSHIYVFKIDLDYNILSLKMASELDEDHAPVFRLGQDPNVLIAINGGFFDKKFRPLGLRISDGLKKNQLKRISWWGIFYVSQGMPYIANPSQHIPGNASFAIQSGPRLIINRRIPSLKNGLAERSAIGITDNNEVILLITDNNRLTTNQLAQIMKSAPLNCRDALNLDGGSSSQLFAKAQDFNLSVHGFSNVSDAILVKRKKK